MAPNPMSSAEWLQVQAAFTDAVSQLRSEVQTGLGGLRSDMGREFSDMRQQLTEIHSSLAEGRTTMEFQREAQEREQRERAAADAEIHSRLEDHSDAFQKLSSLVTAPAPTTAPAPPSDSGVVKLVKEKALEAAVTALVLGVLAVAYNVWRDQAIKEAVDARLKETREVPAHGFSHPSSDAP